MVFLVITPSGLKEAFKLQSAFGIHIWCGAAAISEADYKNGPSNDLSRFIYDFSGPDKAELQAALETIELHHPGETIWVEGAQ